MLDYHAFLLILLAGRVDLFCGGVLVEGGAEGLLHGEDFFFGEIFEEGYHLGVREDGEAGGLSHVEFVLIYFLEIACGGGGRMNVI